MGALKGKMDGKQINELLRARVEAFLKRDAA